jgi:hypothetical protein
MGMDGANRGDRNAIRPKRVINNAHQDPLRVVNIADS